MGSYLTDSILLSGRENLLLLPGTLVQDLFLNSSVKVVDLVELRVDRLDVVDELKVLASIGGVHDVLFLEMPRQLVVFRKEFALNLLMACISGNGQ